MGPKTESKGNKFMNKFIATAAIMAATTSMANAVTVGDQLPAGSFTDHLGKSHTFADFAGKPIVLEWTNYGCPFVRKHYESGNMQKLQKDAVASGTTWLSVISSAEGKEGYLSATDAPGAIAKAGFAGTAVILDSKGTLGQTFGAKATPTMVVADGTGKIVYIGAIDSIPSFSKDDIAKAENYVTAALTAVAEGKAPANAQTKAYGCSVKY